VSLVPGCVSSGGNIIFLDLRYQEASAEYPKEHPDDPDEALQEGHGQSLRVCIQETTSHLIDSDSQLYSAYQADDRKKPDTGNTQDDIATYLYHCAESLLLNGVPASTFDVEWIARRALEGICLRICCIAKALVGALIRPDYKRKATTDDKEERHDDGGPHERTQEEAQQDERYEAKGERTADHEEEDLPCFEDIADSITKGFANVLGHAQL
jgi:hypothetical protein